LALAVRLARAAYDKKAEDIVVLDLRGVSPVTDAFVIVTANNPRLMGAVAEAAEEAAAEMGVRLFGSEGRGGARWVVLDFVDVVVHVFDAPFRRLYDLELLWGDAPRVPWEEAADRT
jgi:ribosome-associated protein